MTRPLGIELKNLRKVYPRQIGQQIAAIAMAALGRPRESIGGGVALSDLTLSIRKGERVGIIGRNGAGKSTLLQMLAGISEPTSGQLHITGKVTAVLTLGVGLREDLSGRENIYLDGEAQGKTHKEIDSHVSAIVEFAELGKFIDLPLRTYSTGMKARLAFSIITQIDPEILIIDEALSVGDAAFSIKAGKRISQLCAQGAIVLVVSHSMQSIRDLCNRCLWLDAGNLLMDGTPQAVTEAYIESVRKADEGENITRFRELVGTQSFSTDYELDEIQLSSDGLKFNKFMSGQPLQIYCKFSVPESNSLGYFILRCIRLDGALISEEKILLNQKLQKKNLSVTYPRFNLAPGLYRIQLKWYGSEGERRAASSTVVEVIANNVPTGGRPVLINVGSIQSFEINKEN
jgi:lipopolysaccharide transport system ATP-binding protein